VRRSRSRKYAPSDSQSEIKDESKDSALPLKRDHRRKGKREKKEKKSKSHKKEKKHKKVHLILLSVGDWFGQLC
jgi:hypothetical protein